MRPPASGPGPSPSGEGLRPPTPNEHNPIVEYIWLPTRARARSDARP